MGMPLNRRGLLAWAGLAAMGRAVASEDEAKPAKLERAAPDAPLGKTLDGKALNLGDFDGKPVIVFFWAAWCPHCRNELPVLDRVQAAAGERLRVIAVNVEERAVFKKIHNRLAEASQMVLTYDPGEVSAKAFQKPASLPYTLVLRADRSVAARQSGWGESSTDFILKHVNAVLADAKGG